MKMFFDEDSGNLCFLPKLQLFSIDDILVICGVLFLGLWQKRTLFSLEAAGKPLIVPEFFLGVF